MDGFYEDAASVFVEAYDAIYDGTQPQFDRDVAFYEHIAREIGEPVLELACGTGRITIPLAEAGHSITGVDLSEGMLTVARRKSADMPSEVSDRLTWIRQDMSELDLGRRFGFVFVPARSFQHLLTVDLQRKALAAIRNHLQPNGRLSLHLFDPRLDFLTDESQVQPQQSAVHPGTGRKYTSEVVRTRFDHLSQIRRDTWRYAEIGAGGEVLREETREMVLRWTYRWELHHLLQLCGIEVVAEYSDFDGTPPAYGKELIIVARPIAASAGAEASSA